MNWPDLLDRVSGFGSVEMQEVGYPVLLLALATSLAASLFLSYLYLVFYRSRATGSQVHRAFPLLGISITAVFITVQFSLPLSLGLLGALSIVRFRTPIKEPEEIGFVMWVVACALSCATFNLLFLALLLAAGVAALVAMKVARGMRTGGRQDGVVIVTLDEDDWREQAEALLSALRDKLPRGRLDSVTETGGESVVSYSFLGLDGSLASTLGQDLRKLAASARTDVFFHRSGEVT